MGKRLEEELTSGRQGKFRISLQAGVFSGDADGPRLHLALELPRSSVRTEVKNHRLWASYYVLGMVYRKGGSLQMRFSDADRFEVLPPPGTQPNARSAVFLPGRYEKQFHLPPGEYHARVIFSDGANYGRAETSLTVEPYDETKLRVSSVMLANREQYVQAAAQEDGHRTLPEGFVPLVSREIEVTPSGSTRFRSGEPLIAYFEIYEPRAARTPDTKIEIQLRVMDAKTDQVHDTLKPIEPAPRQEGDSAVIPIESEIPAENLKKGSYRLEVQASDSTGQRTVIRTANFSIE